LKLIPIAYDIHGFRLRFHSESETLKEILDSALGGFAIPGALPNADDFQLSIRESTDLPNFPAALPLLWKGPLPDGTQLIYRGDANSRWMRLEKLADVQIDFTGNRAQVSVIPGGEWCLLSGCIIPLLAEILRRQEQYLLHAATLLIPTTKKAILLAGAGGRGKTTTALALMHSGMQLVSDDISFVYGTETDNSAPRIWGLLPRLKIRHPTLALLPWLAEVPRRNARLSGEFYLDHGQLPITQLARPTELAAIFVLDGRAETHRIRPLDKAHALELLLRENLRALDQPAGKLFRTMARLIENCDTYILTASPQLHTVADHLISTVENQADA